MAKIMNGEITKPSETTVTEEDSEEPVHVEDIKERNLRTRCWSNCSII